MHLLTSLHRWAANVPHDIPTEATYEEIIGVLENHSVGHNLAAAYHTQLKARTQLVGITVKPLGATLVIPPCGGR